MCIAFSPTDLHETSSNTISYLTIYNLDIDFIVESFN